MIEKKIEVCVGTDEGKNIRARLSLLVVEGNSVLSRQFHSMAISPGDDPAKIRALVEKHIATPGGIPGSPWPKIPDSEWADVEAIVGRLHTPARVAARRARELERDKSEAQTVRK